MNNRKFQGIKIAFHKLGNIRTYLIKDAINKPVMVDEHYEISVLEYFHDPLECSIGCGAKYLGISYSSNWSISQKYKCLCTKEQHTPLILILSK